MGLMNGGYGVEMRAAVEEVEKQSAVEGVEMRAAVEEVEMSQLAHPVFPIHPADGDMHLHLCLVVPLASPLPVRSYHKSDHSCCSGTPWPSDLVAHMHDRPLCAGLCVVVGHGYGSAIGSAHYTSHFSHRSIHLAVNLGQH